MSFRTAFLVVATLGLLIALGGLARGIYVMGFNARGVIAEQEKAEMLAANNRAIAASEKTMREDLAEITQERKRLENANAEQDQAALAAPGADSKCLPADSVRRLDSVR